MEEVPTVMDGKRRGPMYFPKLSQASWGGLYGGIKTEV